MTITFASPAPQFPGLVDLASETLGARVLGCSDEFFAEASNLVVAQPARFDSEAYTDHGKWMDGWESRRRREVGEDWCVVALGVRGRVRALDIDTSHFLGNHAPFARIDACDRPDLAPEQSPDPLDDSLWTPVLAQVPLQAGAHNLFTPNQPCSATHLRLTITPDGGVARLRVFGDVLATSVWDKPPKLDPEAAVQAGADAVDLAALAHGGKALACSDMFFAPMNNLIAPGRSTYMGGGWETRRKRGPGHDWILIELATPGVLSAIEVDTGHFHGNHAQRCALSGVYAPGARISDLLTQDRSAGGWHEVLPASPIPANAWASLIGEPTLGPDRRAFFRVESEQVFTHVRLETFPDGGVARLRVYGKPEVSA